MISRWCVPLIATLCLSPFVPGRLVAAAAAADDRAEVAKHPEILYDGSVANDQMTFDGVRIGDPATKLRDWNRSDGWLVPNRRFYYRVFGGSIVEVRVEREILDTLDLHQPYLIEMRFGLADRVLGNIYYYFKKKMMVTLDPTDSAVTEVAVLR